MDETRQQGSDSTLFYNYEESMATLDTSWLMDSENQTCCSSSLVQRSNACSNNRKRCYASITEINLQRLKETRHADSTRKKDNLTLQILEDFCQDKNIILFESDKTMVDSYLASFLHQFLSVTALSFHAMAYVHYITVCAEFFF